MIRMTDEELALAKARKPFGPRGGQTSIYSPPTYRSEMESRGAYCVCLGIFCVVFWEEEVNSWVTYAPMTDVDVDIEQIRQEFQPLIVSRADLTFYREHGLLELTRRRLTT